jgi:hypothetical protein
MVLHDCSAVFVQRRMQPIPLPVSKVSVQPDASSANREASFFAQILGFVFIHLAVTEAYPPPRTGLLKLSGHSNFTSHLQAGYQSSKKTIAGIHLADL